MHRSGLLRLVARFYLSLVALLLGPLVVLMAAAAMPPSLSLLAPFIL
jgi:hypothetical protein